MMRAASAGPIPGSDSMAAESARSMSTGPDGLARPADVDRASVRFGTRRDLGLWRTESMRSS
jgi:hypothetical protein